MNKDKIDKLVEADMILSDAQRNLRLAATSLIDAAEELPTALKLMALGELEPPCSYEPHMRIVDGLLDNAWLYYSEAAKALERLRNHPGSRGYVNERALLDDLGRRLDRIRNTRNGVMYALKEACDGKQEK